MTRKNNLSPLPFYTDITYQNQNDWYAYGNLFSYNVESGFVPPFQIIIPDLVEATGVLPSTYFDSVSINNVEHSFALDVKSTMLADQVLTAEKFDGDYIIVKNKSASILTLGNWNPSAIPGLPTSRPAQGGHFLAITIDGTTYSSEIFTWKDGLVQTELRYKHNEDFLVTEGHIDYDDSFEHKININSSIGKPEYPFEEEVVKREGYTFPVHQISYKKYRFEFFASEYLTDALRLVRMHDFVEIESEGVVYSVDSILFTVDWQKHGNIAQVVCEFTTDTVVVVSGRSS